MDESAIILVKREENKVIKIGSDIQGRLNVQWHSDLKGSMRRPNVETASVEMEFHHARV